MILGLVPNNEGSNAQYPISFHSPRIESGCICYDLNLVIAKVV
jgi:hypothetical protein